MRLDDFKPDGFQLLGARAAHKEDNGARRRFHSTLRSTTRVMMVSGHGRIGAIRSRSATRYAMARAPTIERFRAIPTTSAESLVAANACHSCLCEALHQSRSLSIRRDLLKLAAHFGLLRCKSLYKYRLDSRGGQSLSDVVVDRIIDATQRRPDAPPDGTRLAGF